jgi:5-methylcytosine-specific restriction endonuclease McrA
MHNNHQITERYVQDFRQKFHSCAEELKLAIDLLLTKDENAAYNFFEQSNTIRYIKGDKVPTYYKALGKLYQHENIAIPEKPNVNERDKFLVFRKDHYQCTYTGIKLINHPIIELLSYVLPEQWPYNNPPHGSDVGPKNTHLLVWVLWPSVDHIVPVSRGGKNELSNYTTSNSKFNMFKGNILKENLGAEFIEPHDKSWNGLESEYFLLFEKYKHKIPTDRIIKFNYWNLMMQV